MNDDNGGDGEKLRNKGQTEMKHQILRLYLKPWVNKVSKVNSKLLFIDGFAGSGIYPDGTRGSPMIAMDVADEVLTESESVSNRIEEFECIFVENNPDYYSKLEKSANDYEKEVDDRINTRPLFTNFEDWVPELIEDYEDEDLPPSLIFVDPFGYSDIPFELLRDFFSLRDQSLELLINLMTGKMATYLFDPDKEQTVTETLGTDAWQDEIDEEMGKDERAELICDIYERQWRSETSAQFTMPFEMVEESKQQICYYLIHVTNHLDGLKVMKKTMFNAGADDKYAYLGPNHTGFEEEQLSFTEFSDTDDFEDKIRSFATDLHDRYEEETLYFNDILRQTLDENVFIPKHYRQAFEILSEEENILKVNGEDYTKGNNVSCKENEAKIEFLEKEMEASKLNDFM